MKIAIVLWESTILGGTQRQALELARSLKHEGHEVGVFCYAYNPNLTYTNARNDLPIYAVTETLSTKPTAIPTSSRTKQFLKKIGLYSVLLTVNQYAQLAKSIFISERKILLLKKRMEEVQPLSYWDVINVHDYEAYKLARVINHPNIVWMLNDLQRTKPSEGSFLHKMYMTLVQRILIKKELRNIRSIAVLDYRNQRLCKEKYGRDSTVVRSGIDLEIFKDLPHERVYAKPLFTLFASSIYFPYRRFEDLLDAMAILIRKGYHNFHLVLNGRPERSYDYFVSIQERVASKNLTSFVTLVQGMSEEVLRKQYVDSDIFVFPNINQTWGMAVLEAMLAGCTCIVSRGSGVHEVLSDNENALLVDPQSPEQIAEKLLFLMNNPQEMERISKNGIAFVKNNLSHDKYAQEMLQVFTTGVRA